jgi:hypothetical protein
VDNLQIFRKTTHLKRKVSRENANLPSTFYLRKPTNFGRPASEIKLVNLVLLMYYAMINNW